jgi:hypothetical protein
MAHNLIASDRVEGTPVCRPTGEQIGVIQRLMIDKLSGQIAYAVLSFGDRIGALARSASSWSDGFPAMCAFPPKAPFTPSFIATAWLSRSAARATAQPERLSQRARLE